jgi:hypothetical protein
MRQNGSLSVLSSIREAHRKVAGCQVRGVEWVGEVLFLVKKIPWQQRKCKQACCCDATTSSLVAKLQSKVFAQFHAVAVKVTVVCGIDCLACQNELFVNNPLTLKIILSMLLNLLFTFPLEGLLLCLRVITINPVLATSDNPGQDGCSF